MRNYEVTFIVDPVLSSDEIDSTAKAYREHLETQGCKIVHIDAMGLRQLAYPLNKRTSGVYYSIEFMADANDLIGGLELALRRDERIIRFLTVKLDKYGVKYNDDKRKGLIGKGRKEQEAAEAAAAEAEAEKAKAAEAEKAKAKAAEADKAEAAAATAEAATATAVVADEEE